MVSPGLSSGSGSRRNFKLEGSMVRALAVACLACSFSARLGAQTQPSVPAAPAIVVSGLDLPAAIASDGTGNLYVVDAGCAIPAAQGDCNVYKETLSGGRYSQSRVTSFDSKERPTSIAVDAGGNVYVGVTGKGLVKESPSGQAWAQSLVGCAFAKPTALAYDGKDTFFVFDAQTGHIYREKATDTCATAAVVASPANVTALAVDSCGDVYLAQSTGSAAIVRETPVMGGYAQSTVGSGMAGLIGVGVDAHGDVYSADVMGGVNVWVPSGRDYAEHNVMKGLSLSPIGPMAFDGANNFYFAEFPNSRIWKVSPSFPVPPALACGAPAAPSGGQATAAPQH